MAKRKKSKAKEKLMGIILTVVGISVAIVVVFYLGLLITAWI